MSCGPAIDCYIMDGYIFITVWKLSILYFQQQQRIAIVTVYVNSLVVVKKVLWFYKQCWSTFLRSFYFIAL